MWIVEYRTQVKKNSYVKGLFKGHKERRIGKEVREEGGRRGKGGKGKEWRRERTGDFGKEGRWKAEGGRIGGRQG